LKNELGSFCKVVRGKLYDKAEFSLVP